MKKHNLKSNKGITLIALIITIIVMLILVAVTVSVALNGGIFDQARTATKETEMAAIYDQIVGAMKLTSNGNVNVAETYSAVKTILQSQGRTVGEMQADGTFEVIGTNGTYTYKITQTEIIKGEITGAGNGGSDVTNPDGTENEGDDEVVITAEKDLTQVIYLYNTMYNLEQPEIVSVSGYYDDENNDKISDKNEFLGAYIYDSVFSIPKTFFVEEIPTQGNISATITHFDGTEENITLTTTDNKEWRYETEGSALTDVDTCIVFRPFTQYNREKQTYEESTEYHYMYIEGEIVVPFYKLKIFNKTIEFPYNCQAMLGGDAADIEPMYTNIDKVSKIIVNFSNNTNKVYLKDDIFNAVTYLGEYYYSSKERPILYAYGRFGVNMPESSLQAPIKSVVVVEDGIATKFNVSDSTEVVHIRPGS